MSDNSKMPSDVQSVFSDWPEPQRSRLLSTRSLLFQVAETTPDVGEIVETLKWGQPSYLTVHPKSGSTVRLGICNDGRPALFCHCQTTLIGQFRELYSDAFDFEGNRALVLRPGRLPEAQLAHCLALALTYHSRKRAA